MNKVEKKIVIFSAAIVILSVIMWLLDGAYLITQTEKLIISGSEGDAADFNVTTKFIWGLDLTLLVSGVVLVIGGLIYRKQESKKD